MVLDISKEKKSGKHQNESQDLAIEEFGNIVLVKPLIIPQTMEYHIQFKITRHLWNFEGIGKNK